MMLINALVQPTQLDALVKLQTGDEVLIAYQGRRFPFSTKRVKVDEANARYLKIGALRFHRRNGAQVGARKSQAIHYCLYALTPEVEVALSQAGAA